MSDTPAVACLLVRTAGCWLLPRSDRAASGSSRKRQRIAPNGRRNGPRIVGDVKIRRHGKRNAVEDADDEEARRYMEAQRGRMPLILDMDETAVEAELTACGSSRAAALQRTEEGVGVPDPLLI